MRRLTLIEQECEVKQKMYQIREIEDGHVLRSELLLPLLEGSVGLLS